VLAAAGGILIAILALLMLAVMIRNVLRTVRRFARNLLVLPILLVALLYMGWSLRTRHVIETAAIAPSSKTNCTGQCLYR
jgi:SNF family Na+-dependent transporter